MTHEEISAMIAGIGLPCAYDRFKDKPGQHPKGPPFICFLYPQRNDFMADDTSYVKITELVIELYTDTPDFDLEAQVEAALEAAELPYDQERRYIAAERMYQTTYTTEVILTDGQQG